MSGGIKLLISFLGGAACGFGACRLWDYYKKEKVEYPVEPEKGEYVSFADICATKEEIKAAEEKLEDLNKSIEIVKANAYVAEEPKEDIPEYLDNIDIINEEAYLELGDDIKLIDLDWYDIDGFFVEDGKIVSSTDYPWLSSDILDVVHEDDLYLLNNESGEAVEIHKIYDLSYYEDTGGEV